MATLSASTKDSGKIRWGRIVAGAILLELALIVVFVPLLLLVDTATIVPLVVAGCLVFGFVFGWWTASKVPARFVLHGTLVGVLATAIYLGLVFAQPGGAATAMELYGPVLFVSANVLRIVGSAAGGAYGGRKQ